jgi:hypothetical protein
VALPPAGARHVTAQIEGPGLQHPAELGRFLALIGPAERAPCVQRLPGHLAHQSAIATRLLTPWIRDVTVSWRNRAVHGP